MCTPPTSTQRAGARMPQRYRIVHNWTPLATDWWAQSKRCCIEITSRAAILSYSKTSVAVCVCAEGVVPILRAQLSRGAPSTWRIEGATPTVRKAAHTLAQTKAAGTSIWQPSGRSIRARTIARNTPLRAHAAIPTKAHEVCCGVNRVRYLGSVVQPFECEMLQSWSVQQTVMLVSKASAPEKQHKRLLATPPPSLHRRRIKARCPIRSLLETDKRGQFSCQPMPLQELWSLPTHQLLQCLYIALHQKDSEGKIHMFGSSCCHISSTKSHDTLSGRRILYNSKRHWCLWCRTRDGIGCQCRLMLPSNTQAVPGDWQETALQNSQFVSLGFSIRARVSTCHWKSGTTLALWPIQAVASYWARNALC